MIIAQTTQPATYPVDVATLRSQLNIDTEDYDARLAGLIAAATEWTEIFIARALISRTYAGYLNWWPHDNIGRIRAWLDLEWPPLISVQAITTYDDNDAGTVWPSTNYYVDTVRRPGRIMLRRGAVWPIPMRMANGIRIDFTAGYGPNPSDVPETIRLAIQILAAVYNENRGDEGLTADPPMAVKALLSPFLTWPAS